MVATTQQLISSLETYLEKCVACKLSFSKTLKEEGNSIFNQKFTDIEDESFEAYWAARKQAQQYQRDNNLSGIAWQEFTYKDKTVRVPHVHDQLVSVPGDREILIAATPAILNWWVEVTEGMDLWREVNGDGWERVQLEQILFLAPQTEWAETNFREYTAVIRDSDTGEKWEEPSLDLNLQLCWGVPEEVSWVYYPESGSEYFDALIPEDDR